jgi:hypothetical protein
MQEQAYRPLHKPKTAADSNLFILQPGSIEMPFLLKVVDFDNDVYMGKGTSQTITIPAYEIALDLVHQWRDNKNMPEDAGVPGIWLCSVDNPSLDQIYSMPETHEAQEKQTTFAASKVREARLHAAQNEWRNITKLHLYMGKLLNIQGEPWQDFDAKAKLGKVRCPYCDAPMTIGVAICGMCREIVDLGKYNQIREAQGLLPKPVPAAAPKPS